MEEIVPKNPINNNTPSGKQPSSTTNCGGATIERKIRPQKDEPVNCPRCNSTNTKFCYYNNYSLSQPRYFCKTCRRYWTEGGSLRNIPVGGGSRKNRLIRSSSIDHHHHQVVVMNNNSKKMNLPQQQQFPSAGTAAAADLMLSSRLPLPLPLPLHPNPNKPTTTTSIQQDLNLSFSSHHHHHHHHHHHQDLKTIAELIQVPNYERNNSDKEGNDNNNNNNNNNNSSAGQLSAMEMLSVGMPTSSPSSSSARGGMMMMSSFLPMPIPDPNTSSVYSSSFSLPEYKPTLNFSFSLDGMNGNNDEHGGYNGHHHHLLQGMPETSTSGRLFFPFEDLKSGTNAAGGDHNNGADEQDRDHHPAAGFCWNGVLGARGASW
ncbi:unnamed protein product [Cuscuta campestris]|uniref:Dof zinc finger protein n=1 Tax=Cuscuta campestris TaxID=132261 RepID=A0A484KXG1_9ASTE|nr:unnamed protein product [Cuscuta campestris]